MKKRVRKSSPTRRDYTKSPTRDEMFNVLDDLETIHELKLRASGYSKNAMLASSVAS